MDNKKITGECCGRPMQYSTESKCNYNDCCMNEYCGCKLGRIKEMEPTCDSTAVIPSITVQSVDGITNLSNCLVHVEDTNTTYYVDDKHRIMITWAGPVDIPGYDMAANPNKYKDQIVTDVENGVAVIYDKHGNGYMFGITQDSLQTAVDNKLDEMAINGTLAQIVATYISDEFIFGFDTVGDMKTSIDLVDGSYARTLGYHAKDDFGGAIYKIRQIGVGENPDEATVISLNDNNLVAELVVGEKVNVNQFGAYGDGTHDDSSAIQKALAYINSKAIVFEQASPNPNWHRYFSTALTLYFPSSQYLVSSKITFNGNRYYSLQGNKSIIKCPNDSTDPVFYFSGSSGTKCDIRNFVFREMANAIEYDATNNDLSHVLIENCDFVGITGIAIKYNNRSCMLKVKNCNFSWCYKIFVNIACDNAEFENCWFSEYEADEDGYASFRLLWGENKFINCFFIPNGGYNTGVDQSTLTELAWIEAGDNTTAVANNPKILLDRCRVSAEPNAKTLINWKVVPSTGNNPTDTYIRILNCHAMSCTLGATIILAWHLPQQVVFENTEISNEAGTFIKFVDGFDAKTEIATYFSGANRLLYTYNYGFKNVKTQTNTAWRGIPAELAPFVKYSDNDVRLPVTNANKTVEFFLGDTNLGSPYGFSKMYLVKGYFFATSNLNSLSSVTGLLLFDSVNSQVETANSIRVKFVKLAQYAGGTPTSSAADINITPTFNDTNSNILTMSSHQNVTIKLTIDNNVYDAGAPSGESYISIKEL